MRVWDNSGEVKSDLKNHTSQVICLEYCEDNKYMASGGSDNKLIIWNTENYTVQKIYNIVNENNNNNNSNLMEIEEKDEKDENIENNDNINDENISDEILDIAWKNSDCLLCGSSNGNIYYYRISEDKVVCVVNKAHNKDINEIAWNKDKSVFATCSDDGKVKLWKEEIIKENEEENVGNEIIKDNQKEEKDLNINNNNNSMEITNEDNSKKNKNNRVRIVNISTLDGHAGIVYTMKWSYSIEHNNLLASYIYIYIKKK